MNITQNKQIKLLIVAQTPPPFHGQAIAQKYLVEAKWAWCQKYHIRLALSKNISEVSKFRFKKILLLIQTVTKIILFRMIYKIRVVYYPPAGNEKIAFYRDIIILSTLKILRFKIIFHFHSGGTSSLYMKLNKFERKIFRKIYFNAYATISLLPSLVEEIKFLNAKHNYVIAAGVPDHYDLKYSNNKIERATKSILFLSNLIETKGVMECLQAAEILADDGIDFDFNFVGVWADNRLQNQVITFISNKYFKDKINFLGFKNEIEKYHILANTDVFCYPSYYPLENQPAVIMEAMMFGIPIISTTWRAIPDMFLDGEEGFAVPVKDAITLAEKLKHILANEDLRIKMGTNARDRYLSDYKIEMHLQRMEEVFKHLLVIN